MRLWSIHPKHLDCRGLVALWREALLARAVLRGGTRGYRNHPQLERFRAHPRPLDAIERYLSVVQREGARRGYAFDASKLGKFEIPEKIPVTNGQLRREFAHLDAKLRSRDVGKARDNRSVGTVMPHPLFREASGDVVPWEKAPPVGKRAE